jgi:alkylation response protein AidB-like acyl-CoA dehydrogenase
MADAASLLAAAQGLAPLVAEHRAALARERDLPAPLAAALDAAGLTRLWLPRGLGGAELSPADYIRVIEAVGWQDGALGWCAAVAASGARLAGLLAPEVAADMFGPARGALCGSVNPAGTATEVAGGWRVSGRWSYGSFIRHSAWTLGMCRVAGVAGPPRLLAAIAPTAEVRIHDTWDAGGLRATGSHDFEFSDVFVPAERTIALPGFDAPAKIAGRLFDLPFVTAFTIGITPVALGIARRAIAALVDLAAQKIPAGTAAPLREQPGVQMDIARAEAELRAARALLFEAVEDLWAAADPREIRLRAGVRLACWNAVRASKHAASLMHDAAGGSALDERLAFAACLRDVTAAGQHLAFAGRNMEAVGRVLLGMEPGTARF